MKVNNYIFFFSFCLLSLYVTSYSSETPLTVARQAPLSMGFPRQEDWRGLPFPSPGDLPNPGIEPGSPVLQSDSLYLWARQLIRQQGAASELEGNFTASKILTLNPQAPSPCFTVRPQEPRNCWSREAGSQSRNNFTTNFHSPFRTLRSLQGH